MDDDLTLAEALNPLVPVDASGLDETVTEGDEALDDAARGASGTSDETDDGTGEIAAIGRAAGLIARDDKPLRGIDEVERRDEHRWELDPASADADATVE